MNNTIAGNELADTLELLLLDMNEGYGTQAMNGPPFVEEALAAIHLYRVRTGTQRVRPATAVID